MKRLGRFHISGQSSHFPTQQLTGSGKPCPNITASEYNDFSFQE
jgi:hypothetical protein